MRIKGSSYVNHTRDTGDVRGSTLIGDLTNHPGLAPPVSWTDFASPALQQKLNGLSEFRAE